MITALIPLLTTRSASFNPETYPYGTTSFSQFIEDSQARFGSPSQSNFYAWMDRAAGRSLIKDADTLRKRITAAKPADRPQIILTAASDLHRLVKKSIPMFSLERGYEFYYVVTKGERQCFLQSVLIAGILQRAGIDAGVVMVWKNEKGSESILGHAVTVVKNTNGSYFLVDASAPKPFMTHQGLFGRGGAGYKFVSPIYKGTNILGFANAEGVSGRPIALGGLPINYLRSQFDYYRGERAVNGFMTPPRTPVGLADSAKFLEKAVAESKENPLAMYVLGHVYKQQGRLVDADKAYQTAYKLFAADGHIPDGPRKAAGK
jgi:hypothetical protein